jgi:hypothetical protein
MGSSVPSFSLSRLRAAFSASWNWSNRPAYQFKIRHQFELGGFDVKAGPGIDLDPIGLEWMRTLELSSRTTGIGYRMMLFDDLDVILPGFPGPSPEMLDTVDESRAGLLECVARTEHVPPLAHLLFSIAPGERRCTPSSDAS